MEVKNLKEIINQVADAALDNPQFMQLYKGVSVVLSYLESEQDKRKKLHEAMEKLKDRLDQKDKDDIAIKLHLDHIKERSEKNGKILEGVFTGVIVAIILQLLSLAYAPRVPANSMNTSSIHNK